MLKLTTLLQHIMTILMHILMTESSQFPRVLPNFLLPVSTPLRRNPKVASLSRIPKQQKINLGHRILRNRSKRWVGSLPRIPKQQKINRAQEHGYVELDQKGKNQQDSWGARRLLYPPEAIQRTNHLQSPPKQ
mmetsp:Transcript_31118/g.65233  ORF Transcript_31118/g.65233 Transcript_31118/m.65233 type:complete len:133 (+) Transcript_31118:285-683(+)